MSYPPRPYAGAPPAGYGAPGGYRDSYGGAPPGPSRDRSSYAGGPGHSVDPYYGRGARDSLSSYPASPSRGYGPPPGRDISYGDPRSSYGGNGARGGAYDSPGYLSRGVREDPYGNDHRRSDYGGHDPLSRTQAGPRGSRSNRDKDNTRGRDEIYNKREHWLLTDYDEPRYGADSAGRFGQKSPGFEKALDSAAPSRRRRSSIDELKDRAYGSKQSYRGPTTEYGQGSIEYNERQNGDVNGTSVARRRSSRGGNPYDDPFSPYGGVDASQGIGSSRRTHTYGTQDDSASLRTHTSPYDYHREKSTGSGIAYGHQRFAQSTETLADIRDPAYEAFRGFDEREPAWGSRSNRSRGHMRSMASFGDDRANGFDNRGGFADEDPGDIFAAAQSSRRPRRETGDASSRIETEITHATGVGRRNSVGSSNGARDRAVSIQRSPAINDLAVSRGSSVGGDRGESSAAPPRRRLSTGAGPAPEPRQKTAASRYGRKAGNEKVAKLSSLLERAAVGKPLDKYDQQPWEKMEDDEANSVTVSRKQLRGVDVYCWRASTHVSLDAETVVEALRGPDPIRAYDKFCREAHVIERIDDHTQVYRAAYDSDSMLSSDRDFVLLEAVNRMSESGNWVIMTRSVIHPQAPEHSGYVRGEVMFSGYVVIPARQAGCTLVSLVQVDPKGWLPAFLANGMAEEQARKLGSIKSWLHQSQRRRPAPASRFSEPAPAPARRKRSGSVYNQKEERFDSSRATDQRTTRDRARSQSRQESSYPSDRVVTDRTATGRRSPAGGSRWA